METGIVLFSILLGILLTLLVLVTGVFRNILQYAVNLILVFIIMTVFAAGFMQFIINLP